MVPPRLFLPGVHVQKVNFRQQETFVLSGGALGVLRVYMSDGWTPALDLRFSILGEVQQE